MDLTLISCSSPEHEVRAVPRVIEPEMQMKTECSILSVPIVAKNVQRTSQNVAENCPILSTPIVEKGQDRSQSNAESCRYRRFQ